MFRYAGALVGLFVNIIVVAAILEVVFGTTLALVLSTIIVIVSICLFLTPVGTQIMRIQNHLQKPTDLERKRVEPIFRDVYEKAKKKTPNLPNDIQWFIIGDKKLNAVAIGRHTIGVHIGLLEQCRDSEIAAVLAHEFGHIAHWDTINSILIVESNYWVIVLKKFCVFSAKIIVWGVSLIFALMNNSELVLTIGDYISKFISWLLNIYLSAIYRVCSVISFAGGREQEYSADRYAAELGIYQPLMDVLSKLSSPTRSFRVSISEMFYGTHPSNEKRIERLQQFAQSQK